MYVIKSWNIPKPAKHTKTIANGGTLRGNIILPGCKKTYPSLAWSTPFTHVLSTIFSYYKIFVTEGVSDEVYMGHGLHYSPLTRGSMWSDYTYITRRDIFVMQISMPRVADWLYYVSVLTNIQIDKASLSNFGIRVGMYVSSWRRHYMTTHVALLIHFECNTSLDSRHKCPVICIFGWLFIDGLNKHVEQTVDLQEMPHDMKSFWCHNNDFI